MQKTNTTPKSRSDGRGHPNTPIVSRGASGVNNADGPDLNVVRLEDLDSEYVERLRVRFWEKVDWTDDPDECWEWTGSGKGNGYGQISVRAIQKAPYGAHRVSFLLTYGYVDESLQVHHSCDNPPCQNPAHLSQGTNQKNSEDAHIRGRCQTALSAAQVLEARKRIAAASHKSKVEIAALIRSLAAEYGVRALILRYAICGETWEYLPGAVHLLGVTSNAKFDEAQIYEIRGRVKCGELQKSVADDFGTDATHIYYIMSRRLWKHLPDREPTPEERAIAARRIAEQAACAVGEVA